VSKYSLPKLLKLWEQAELTIEQVIGQILQPLVVNMSKDKHPTTIGKTTLGNGWYSVSLLYVVNRAGTPS
jgi:hypothetical protein